MIMRKSRGDTAAVGHFYLTVFYVFCCCTAFQWRNKVSKFKQQNPFVGLSQHNRTISEHRRVWEAANRRRIEKLCLSAPLYSRPSF